MSTEGTLAPRSPPKVLVARRRPAARSSPGSSPARGARDDDAAAVADALVWANLRGIDSHGVSRVPRYLELFDKGESVADAVPTVERPRAAIAIVDAHAAPGPVALTRAADEAVACARDCGIGWASVRGTVHTGAIGYYTSQIAGRGHGRGRRGRRRAEHGLRRREGRGRRHQPAVGRGAGRQARARAARHGHRGDGARPDRAAQGGGQGAAARRRAHRRRRAHHRPGARQGAHPGRRRQGRGHVAWCSRCWPAAWSPTRSCPPTTPAARKAGGTGRTRSCSPSTSPRSCRLTSSPPPSTTPWTRSSRCPPPTAPREILVPGERGRRSQAERAASGIPLGPKVWRELTEIATSLDVPVPAPLGRYRSALGANRADQHRSGALVPAYRDDTGTRAAAQVSPCRRLETAEAPRVAVLMKPCGTVTWSFARFAEVGGRYENSSTMVPRCMLPGFPAR